MNRNLACLCLSVLISLLAVQFRPSNEAYTTKSEVDVKGAATGTDRLRINELSLGMTRREVDLTPSMIDGRALRSTHHRSECIELVGHVRFGIDSCSWIAFSKDDQLIAIRGLNLFLDEKEVHAKLDGSIPELGAPSLAAKDGHGNLVFVYPEYSLKVILDKSGDISYNLGEIDLDP